MNDPVRVAKFLIEEFFHGNIGSVGGSGYLRMIKSVRYLCNIGLQESWEAVKVAVEVINLEKKERES